MPNVTLDQITDAVADTLFTATNPDSSATFSRLQRYDEITEEVEPPDLPCLQVYWEDVTIDPSGQTDRTAFVGGVRQKAFVIHADLLCKKRVEVDQDMKAVHDVVDAIIDVIETQNLKPYFGLAGIKAFNVRISRGNFEYASSKIMGARCVVNLWVY